MAEALAHRSNAKEAKDICGVWSPAGRLSDTYCTYGLRVRSCFINRYLGGKMAAPTPDVCSIIVELVLLHFGRENRENGGRVYYVECHAVISTHLPVDLLD